MLLTSLEGHRKYLICQCVSHSLVASSKTSSSSVATFRLLKIISQLWYRQIMLFSPSALMSWLSTIQILKEASYRKSSNLLLWISTFRRRNSRMVLAIRARKSVRLRKRSIRSLKSFITLEGTNMTPFSFLQSKARTRIPLPPRSTFRIWIQLIDKLSNVM